jgi:preprotein translocase subunit SecE
MAKSSRRRVASRSQAPSTSSLSRGGGRGGDGRGSGGTPPTATAATPTPRPAGRRRFRPFGWLARFRPRAVTDIISELRKVTWPTPGDTRYLTFVVIVVAIIMGLILGAFDLAFGWIIERLFFD